MITDEFLKALESEMDGGENIDHCDVRDLVEEVRMRQSEVARLTKENDTLVLQKIRAQDERNLATAERDTARKAAKAWKRLAKQTSRHADDMSYSSHHWCRLWREQLDKTDSLRAAFDALRQQARAWKRKALEYRNAPASERHELSELLADERLECGHAIDTCRVLEQENKEMAAVLDATRVYTRSLEDRVASLVNAVNRYCESRNFCGGLEHHTSYGHAIDKLYELARESGFRPRYVAESVPEGSR